MHRLDRSSAPRPVPRITAAWIGLALVAAGASFGVAPLAVAQNAAPSCPAGQIAATRIDYEGKYNPGPGLAVLNLQELAPNVGYTRRTVLVGNGYYKQTSEGTIAVVKDTGPGKPVPIPGTKLFVRELPSRFVIPWASIHKLREPEGS